MSSLSVTVHEQDPATADSLARQLRAELLALDIEDARFDTNSHEVVPGSKGIDPAVLTTIVVTFAGSPVLRQLARVLQDFVNRDRHREITVKRGEDSLTIKGSPDADALKAIESFLDPTDN